MKNVLINKLKELGVVQHKKFKLTSGGTADFYIDLKMAYGYPDILSLMCKCMKPHVKSVTCVAGIGHGGVPLATALASKYKLKLSLVREKPKKHGTRSQIDGHIPNKGDKVLIVDDVLTTGGSLKKVLNILKPTGTRIIGCAVVVKRGDAKLKVPLHYILELSDVY